MIAFSFNQKTLLLGVIAILISLIARYISLYIPTLVLSIRNSFERHMIPILTWGGLRGGISVALALSLPRGPYRDLIISITYTIVVFSIIVQGLTLGKFAKKMSIS